MAETTLTLEHGLAVGDQRLHEVVLREVTAGDIIDARAAGEKLVWSPKADGGGVEPVLVESAALVDAHLICAQVVRIGDISGPFEIAQIKKLHPADFAALLGAADTLDGAQSAESLREGLGERGRDDPDQQSSAAADPAPGR